MKRPIPDCIYFETGLSLQVLTPSEWGHYNRRENRKSDRTNEQAGWRFRKTAWSEGKVYQLGKDQESWVERTD